MSWAMAGSAAISIGSSYLSSKNTPKNSNSSTRVELDPRMAQLLYGDGGDNVGLANLLYQKAVGGTPAGQTALGAGIDSYLKDWGTDSFMQSQQAAQALQNSTYQAPGVEAAQVGRARVNAPSQNGLDLSGGFNDMIYGQAGANPYLTGAIQKGINQSTNAFRNLQEDSTQNLLQSVLPSIDSGAIAAGQYGGSRQGLAQGQAISDFTKQQQRALSQFGQNNTDAAVAAQAGAYDADRNRALSALTNLSGQQYGVASQNANLEQQTNNANASLWADAQRLNQQSNLQTNQLNSANRAAGVGLSSGLLGQAYGMGQSTANSDLDRYGRVSGYLSPFSGLGGSSTTSQPYSSNTAGNILGGAAAGLGLWNQLGGMGGSGGSGASAFSGAANNWGVSPGSAGSTSWLSNIGW